MSLDCVFTRQKGLGSSVGCFSWALQPHNLIISQRPHLLTHKFQHTNFGGTHSVYVNATHGILFHLGGIVSHLIIQWNTHLCLIPIYTIRGHSFRQRYLKHQIGNCGRPLGVENLRHHPATLLRLPVRSVLESQWGHHNTWAKFKDWRPLNPSLEMRQTVREQDRETIRYYWQTYF